MTAFILKIIALAAMLVDHIGAAFPAHTPLMFRVIGRLTFPIFVFLLAEGFRHTRSPAKFLLRLLAFAIISEPFYDLALTRVRLGATDLGLWQVDFFNYTNIFYTLFLGGMAIAVFQWLNRQLRERFLDIDKKWKPLFSNASLQPSCLVVAAIAALPTAGFMWLANYLGSDYGGYGVLFIFAMYAIKTPKWLMLAFFALMNVYQHESLFYYFRGDYIIALEFYLMIPVTLLTVPLIAIYNGRRGPSMKWLFYVAYPAHLAALAGLVYLLL